MVYKPTYISGGPYPVAYGWIIWVMLLILPDSTTRFERLEGDEVTLLLRPHHQAGRDLVGKRQQETTKGLSFMGLKS